MKAAPSRLRPGDVLCDMHYGLRDLWLAGTWSVVSHLRIPFCGGSAFLRDNLRRLSGGDNLLYSNKMLTVIDVRPDGADYNVIAGYSYDNLNFGLVHVVCRDD